MARNNHNSCSSNRDNLSKSIINNNNSNCSSQRNRLRYNTAITGQRQSMTTSMEAELSASRQKVHDLEATIRQLLTYNDSSQKKATGAGRIIGSSRDKRERDSDNDEDDDDTKMDEDIEQISLTSNKRIKTQPQHPLRTTASNINNYSRD